MTKAIAVAAENFVELNKNFLEQYNTYCTAELANEYEVLATAAVAELCTDNKDSDKLRCDFDYYVGQFSE
jgi:hypothetical protein